METEFLIFFYTKYIIFKKKNQSTTGLHLTPVSFKQVPQKGRQHNVENTSITASYTTRRVYRIS